MMFKRLSAILFVTILLCAHTAMGQNITPRISSLADNADYMSMLEQDAALQLKLDSISCRVDAIRDSLRNEPQSRVRYSKSILEMEKQIFDMREQRGRLVNRINAVEQEWVLANLHSPKNEGVIAEEDPAMDSPDSLKVRSLVDNLYFKNNLPQADYAALLAAQRDERMATGYVDRLAENYTRLAAMKSEYDTLRTEKAAVDLYGRYQTLMRLNDVLGDSLTMVWSRVFDNKTYAYGYLMDKAERDDILSKEEAMTSEARRLIWSLKGKYASDAMTDYYVRKQLVTDYELLLAKKLSLHAAEDSLADLSSHLKAVDYRLPKIEIQERYFLDYAPISFSHPSIYNYKNPIPECKVYARGTIYRILVGTYRSKQSVTAFRGVHPLSWLADDNGEYRYFAGAYAARSEVEAAVDVMRGKGFRNPEIVVWNDGVYSNLSKSSADGLAVMFRVEISGVDQLSDAVKAAILETAEGRDLSRLGTNGYAVGLFDDKAIAERVADAVRNADSSLEIKVADIAE